MPRLHNTEINDLVGEDHTCPGCDRDHMDCMCGEFYEDLMWEEPDHAEYPDLQDDEDLWESDLDRIDWWDEP